jgi:hypothetical protein
MILGVGKQGLPGSLGVCSSPPARLWRTPHGGRAREQWSAEAGDIRGVGHRRTRGAWLAATLLLAAMGLLLLGYSRWVRHYNEGCSHMALVPGILPL